MLVESLEKAMATSIFLPGESRGWRSLVMGCQAMELAQSRTGTAGLAATESFEGPWRESISIRKISTSRDLSFRNTCSMVGEYVKSMHEVIELFVLEKN